ncbi:MAG: Gfo/Idh/MocA family oxidoreductase [Thermoguttaceae bacterium]|nr:Gfo/Idh/MocA family oxidoreductase [Thermoguttaceae bacterium]
MNLTSEQKAIGKENFLAAIGSKLTRREFLKSSARADLASGKGLGSYYFKYGTVDKPVRVAVLGTGDEGSVLIGGINPKYIQVVAIADCRPYNQYRAFHGDCYSSTAAAVRPGLMKKYGWKTEEEARQHVKVYNDYRDLLKDADKLGIEGVIIGLPLFLHAPAAILAMRAGCHVLTEKLMGHSVAKCKEMIRVSHECKKHLAIGHQRHYNILYDHATNLINSTVIGDVHYVRAQWHRGNLPGNDSWQMPLPEGSKAEDVKKGELMRELDDWTAELNRLKAEVVVAEGKIQEIEKTPDDQKTRAQIDDAKRLQREKVTNQKAIDALQQKVDQKKAQCADYILINGGEYQGVQYGRAEDYGYTATVRKEGDQTYQRPAIEELIRWRLWDRTGGGLMAELGSHQLDAANIFVAAMHGGKKQRPLSVSASGSRSLFNSLDRDVDDHVAAIYEYPGQGYDPSDILGSQRKITVAYATINGNGFGGYGEVVFGTKGTLQIDSEKEAYLYRTSAINDKIKVAGSVGKLDVPISEDGDQLSAAIGYQGVYATDVSRGYCEELEHWAYCVRKNPNCDPDAVDEEIMPQLCQTFGAQSFGDSAGAKPALLTRCRGEVAIWDAIIALVTNISAALNETIEFKDSWFDYDSDETPELEYAERLVRNAAEPGTDEKEIQAAIAAAQDEARVNLGRPEYSL